MDTMELATPTLVKESMQTAARFLAHDTPANLVVGQSAIVNMSIENIGLTKWQHNSARSVHIGYRWINQAGMPQLDVEDRRTGLPADVYPRQQVTFGAILVAPKTPGTYELHWNLVAEGTQWSDKPLIVPVSVTQTPADITGWRAESNLNIARVSRVLDGDPNLFWNSDVVQTKGQWFRLNLTAPRIIDGIQFLSPGKGFPRAYSLRVSGDGRTWNQVARVESENQHDVIAIFAPLAVQYAQIDLLGTAPENWLISEVLIHQTTSWMASASHNSKLAPCAIDNRPDTVWSSGAAQTPEMWFQIDLGYTATVSGITLVAPAGEHPASYRVSVWNASKHRWQTVLEKLDNTEPLDISFAATQTQFVNVQLLQGSNRRWSIQQAHVAREVENWLGPRT